MRCREWHWTLRSIKGCVHPLPGKHMRCAACVHLSVGQLYLCALVRYAMVVKECAKGKTST